MLWLFWSIGLIGGVFFLIRTMIEMFYYKGKTGKLPDCVHKTVQYAVIFVLCFAGIQSIDLLSYQETVQTQDYKVAYIIDNQLYYKVRANCTGKIATNADNVVIKEEDCKPHVLEYTTYTKSKLSDFWRLLLVLDAFDPIVKSYEVYAPESFLQRLQ